MYPQIKEVNLPMLNFPTEWQAVIFRNYGFVDVRRIASVLQTTVQTVELEAEKLGLKGIKYNPKWEKSGYITIIRNNWYLLEVGQLCTLLGWDRARLEYTLKEEDFLYVKLSHFKPQCKKIIYTPLTSLEEKETKEIRSLIEPLGIDEGKPFDFFSGNALSDVEYKKVSGNRIIHGYLSPCGDVFTVDSKEYLSDELLSQYQMVGINGLWLHAILSSLSPYPFNDKLCVGYENRRKEINNLIERCARFNIKVYLYFNEPRGIMPNNLTDLSLKGHTAPSGEVALCLSDDKVKEYLYNAFKDLLENVKGLGGIITITMSENLTHCLSRGKTNCEKCKDVLSYEYPVFINNTILKAIKDSKNGCELIANLWGWTDFWGFTPEMRLDALKQLDKDISVMCVSELDLEIEKQGVKSTVAEYSISNVGPSKATVEILNLAKKTNHKIYAKIQVNNSWEMSATPNIPVYDLVYEHLSNLDKLGVKNFMLSWTLGGYPSLSLNLVNAFTSGVSLEKWYKDNFKDNADAVHSAVKKLCDAFKEFPYCVSSLYYAPKNVGYGNMWSIENDGRGGAMVGLTFDRYESWIYPYTIDQYLNAYTALISGWKDGLDDLKNIPNGNLIIDKIKLYATVAFLHFKADYHQTIYSFYKRNKTNYYNELRFLFSESLKEVYELIDLCKSDATIGYEASNHYFYTIRQLKEKIINLKKLNKNFIRN